MDSGAGRKTRSADRRQKIALSSLDQKSTNEKFQKQVGSKSSSRPLPGTGRDVKPRDTFRRVDNPNVMSPAFDLCKPFVTGSSMRIEAEEIQSAPYQMDKNTVSYFKSISVQFYRGSPHWKKKWKLKTEKRTEKR